MKKYRCYLFLSILSCSLLAACSPKTDTQSDLPDSEANNIQNSPDSEIDVMQPWQISYIDYLKNDSQTNGQDGYGLIYLDGDDIPELVEIGNCEAAGCRIITYTDGDVSVTQLSRLNFSYIEYGNLLCNSDGLMDYYYDIVYRITDGILTEIAAGYYGAADSSNLQIDDKGFIIYEYEWNGVKMSEENYTQELNRIYDTSQAITVYDRDRVYSPDEIIEIVEQYEL